MKTNIPKCNNHVLLINRAAVNLCGLGGQLFLNGQPSNIINQHNHTCYPVKAIFDYGLKTEVDKLEFHYVRKGDYEEPLFILAPCGKCELCTQRKQNELVFRAALESAAYDCPAYFFTLTYSPKYLPHHGELRYKDVQDFFKRLRIKWTRRGLKHNIRYLVAGEYGSNPQRGHRPHYHVILWNNPYQCGEYMPLEHRQLRDDIFSAWSMSEPQAFDFGQCQGGAAQYATKYCGKDSATFGHWHKPFIRCSCGHGGLGYPTIAKDIDYYHANPQLRQFSFRSFDGTIMHVNFGSYISSKLWPSPSRCVNSTLKSKYKQLADTLHTAVSIGQVTHEDARSLLNQLRPSPNVIPNRFNPKSCKPYKICQTAAKLYYLTQLQPVISDLMDDLSEYTQVSETYLSLFQQYKSFSLPNEETSGLAFDYMQARQRRAVQQSKLVL